MRILRSQIMATMETIPDGDGIQLCMINVSRKPGEFQRICKVVRDIAANASSDASLLVLVSYFHLPQSELELWFKLVCKMHVGVFDRRHVMREGFLILWRQTEDWNVELEGLTCFEPCRYAGKVTMGPMAFYGELHIRRSIAASSSESPTVSNRILGIGWAPYCNVERVALQLVFESIGCDCRPNSRLNKVFYAFWAGKSHFLLAWVHIHIHRRRIYG